MNSTILQNIAAVLVAILISLILASDILGMIAQAPK
jgi:hypothetical protein